MKYRKLGKTNFKVSEVGFGCMAIGNEAYELALKNVISDKLLKKIIDKSIDLGCNFFETSDNYGKGLSEKRLSKVLGERINDVIVATKIGKNFYDYKDRKKDFREEYLSFAVNQSMKRLQLKTLPLLQLHGPHTDVIIDGGIFKIMEKMRDEQLIQNYGISVNSCKQALLVLKTTRDNGYNLSTIQVVYNILDKRMNNDVIPEAKKMNVGVIVRESLCRGFLSGKYDKNSNFPGAIQKLLKIYDLDDALRAVEKVKLNIGNQSNLIQYALKFVLENSGVSVVIPGIKNLQHLNTNLGVSDLHLKNVERLHEIEDIKRLNK